MDDGPRRVVVTGMGIASEAEDVGAIVARGGGGLTTFERRSRVIFGHDPGCDLDYVPGATRVLPMHTAMSDSFEFEGYDISLIFCRLSDGVTA